MTIAVDRDVKNQTKQVELSHFPAIISFKVNSFDWKNNFQLHTLTLRPDLHIDIVTYCKFGNFCENFILGNSFKRHIFDVKYSRHDLPTCISVNDRVIWPFYEGFVL